MSKWVEVVAQVTKVFAVEIDDDDDKDVAIDIIVNDCDEEIDEYESRIMSDIEQLKRHADQVIPI